MLMNSDGEVGRVSSPAAVGPEDYLPSSARTVAGFLLAWDWTEVPAIIMIWSRVRFAMVWAISASPTDEAPPSI